VRAVAEHGHKRRKTTVTEGAFVPLGPRFEEALLYATRVHALQRRKGTGVPYIAHLLAVAAIVGEGGGDRGADRRGVRAT